MSSGDPGRAGRRVREGLGGQACATDVTVRVRRRATPPLRHRPVVHRSASHVRSMLPSSSNVGAISSDCLASWAGLSAERDDPAATAAAAAPGLQEFVVPGTDPVPFGIVAGPDGNLWFTSPGADRVGRLTPGGAVTLFALPTSKSLPSVSPPGRTATSGSPRRRPTASAASLRPGLVTEFVLPDEASPIGITAGPGGALWFTESGLNRIGRLTTAGVLSHFDLPGGSDGGPSGIAAGADGNLWYTDLGLNAIGRLTPAGQATLSPCRRPRRCRSASPPAATATSGSPNSSRARSGASLRPAPSPSSRCPAPTASPSESPAGRMVRSGSPRPRATRSAASRRLGAVTEFDLGRPGAGPFGIAAGPGNTIWFSESLAARIGRLPAGGGGGAGSCTPNATTLCLAGPLRGQGAVAEAQRRGRRRPGGGAHRRHRLLLVLRLQQRRGGGQGDRRLRLRPTASGSSPAA